MATFLVITELKDNAFRKVSYEVLTQARRLGDGIGAKVVALHIGADESAKPASLGEYGADQVLSVNAAGGGIYQAEAYAQFVAEAIKKVAAEKVFFPATGLGRDLAPRVAARLDGVLAADCLQLELIDGNLQVDRPLYAGKMLARLSLSGSLQMASLRPNVLPVTVTRPGASAPVEGFAPAAVPPRVTLSELRAKDSSKLDVSDADIIVTGGRGMRGPEHFKMLEELAALLNGAVGATRAVVDAGWRPHEDQIGQTGKVVSPSLYFMCGASGSIQHWAGMSGSKCIVAINKDANAPIFQRADYGIVGDVFEVLPALTEAVKKLRG